MSFIVICKNMLLPLQKQKARNNTNAKPEFLNIVLQLTHYAQCSLFLLKYNNSTICKKIIHIFKNLNSRK